MSDVYSRTTQAAQGDTLDAICYQYYADRSNVVLPQLINSNDGYSPFALLPLHAVVVLPDDIDTALAPTIKLWN